MAVGGFQDSDRWVRSPNDVAYRRVRDNLTGLVAEIPGLDRVRVPACPQWTVRDVLAHVVGISHKVATRSGQAGAPPPFPGVDAEPDELVRTWHAVSEPVDRVLRDQPDLRAHIMVMDALTHELDIRYALGLPVPDEHAAVCGAMELLVIGFTRGIRERGLHALRIETSGAKWIAGDGEPAGSVSADRYDLYRSLAGRRTPAQIAELTWSGPPGPWLRAFEWGPFHPPADPVEQLDGPAGKSTQRMAG
ncbi:maleylpyruvate isomerase family mycothiol-dependent enzyme [Actinocrispum wychmicini]|uniref:Uncharacterized protein (TIGR03083 family) n=1 Tax=Actinocrispum wychmicini TaxID=1213861 RepID=A0A4R2J620_9PSEU|nr:maleylpyruvate isomerase family mycothiol-dependent enzyme [Actinocrispum wychmicini]TCO54403.1 uncharacterized protein (TIGR03083 family) [Actinocrispum wychmicini]